MNKLQMKANIADKFVGSDSVTCEHGVEDKVHLFLWFNFSNLVLKSMEETIIEAVDVHTFLPFS